MRENEKATLFLQKELNICCAQKKMKGIRIFAPKIQTERFQKVLCKIVPDKFRGQFASLFLTLSEIGFEINHPLKQSMSQIQKINQGLKYGRKRAPYYSQHLT